MRKILRLAKREYKTAIRSKGFIVGLIVAPILMGGSGIGMVLLKDRVDTDDKVLVVVDRSGAVADAVLEAAEARNASEIFDEEGKQIKPAYRIEIATPSTVDPAGQRLALSERVRRGEIYSFVDIGTDVLHPGADEEARRIRYHGENAAVDELRRWLAWPINNHLRSLRLGETGVDPDAVADLFAWMSVEGLGLVSVDEATGALQDARRSNEAEAIAVPVIMMFLMFIMFMMGAMPLLQSVMEEKSQRIAEVLLGSATPFQFMMGKVLGGVAVSLTGSIVYVIGGVIAVKRMGLSDYIPFDILPWFFAYVVLAILMLGSMFAALGAACNDAKDAQSLTMPAIVPVMIPMFVIMPVVHEPLADFATWLSLFPPFTPMLMLLRQSTPVAIPSWQPWAGLAGIIVFALLAVWAGGRIFRIGILMQGQTPKISEIARWAIRG